jgi:4,5-DOPA dioxygenase extradiol
MLPAIFVSHGAPTLPLDPCPAREFLKSLGRNLPRPRAVLAISPHWETATPELNRVALNETIHDYYGFPEALYRLEYPAPGSAALADRAKQALVAAGIKATTEPARGLDHGAWVPLMLMYPEADIPVVQLSIQTEQGPAHHVKLGRALAPFRDDVLVLGTGGLTHNLRLLTRGQVDAPAPQWANDFAEWVHDALTAADRGFVDYRKRAPNAALAHPSEDHFMRSLRPLAQARRVLAPRSTRAPPMAVCAWTPTRFLKQNRLLNGPISPAI